MKGYNKLIRDKIPEIVMQKESKTCNTKVLNDKEYIEELNKKLQKKIKLFLQEQNLIKFQIPMLP